MTTPTISTPRMTVGDISDLISPDKVVNQGYAQVRLSSSINKQGNYGHILDTIMGPYIIVEGLTSEDDIRLTTKTLNDYLNKHDLFLAKVRNTPSDNLEADLYIPKNPDE